MASMSTPQALTVLGTPEHVANDWPQGHGHSISQGDHRTSAELNLQTPMLFQIEDSGILARLVGVPPSAETWLSSAQLSSHFSARAST